MSMASWKKQYYPRSASRRMTTLEAIEHSLQKWLGLRPETLAKHGLNYDDGAVEENNTRSSEALRSLEAFLIDSSTCALCQMFLENAVLCGDCPLGLVLGRQCDLGDDSPYWAFVERRDPEPMIAALRVARRRAKAKELRRVRR